MFISLPYPRPCVWVESLFQTQFFFGLSPAPYQDIQLFVLMAGKVELSVLDSHRLQEVKTNGPGLFPAALVRV